ncbi:Protein kinase domain-containing protein [Mycena kentingensis (nom. inval.)]|nr:Protein kinase domain-containing protein [Mycena kentingensis (nom. inval.)]
MSTVPLRAHEMYWFNRREFLEVSGYRLRPKFHPNYVPDLSTDAGRREFQYSHPRTTIMDAQSISDNSLVMLKAVAKSVHPYEVEIASFFSSPALVSQRNHCIKILEMLNDPMDADKQILVMPRLKPFDEPNFDTVGEVVDCFRQIFEAVEFMHENYVAHRDCGLTNIVLDPTKLFPYGFHPLFDYRDPRGVHPARHITRTECWPRYFLIDFGLSRRYDPTHGPPDEDIIYGADKPPPEHRQLVSCNPFPTDIYFLGNLLKTDFLYRQARIEEEGSPCASLRFLEPLITAMTLPDPSERPTIGEVIVQFDELCSKLGEWHLRRQGQKHAFPSTWIRFFRQVKRVVLRVPPVPPYTPRTDRPALTPEMRAFYTQTRAVEKLAAHG